MQRRWSIGIAIVSVLVGLAAVATLDAAKSELMPLRREVKTFHLYATDGYLETADGRTLYIWGYSLENRPGSATLPGPLLEVNEGDIVKITLTNIGPSKEGVHHVPHTIHLHGLDVNQENDGVPDTAPPVRVGQSFTYVFEATHAGTYWYHCHVDTVEHLTMGMYGALIVHAANGAQTAWTGGPAYDRAYTLLLSEVDPEWSQAIAEDRSAELTRYEPRYFMINGKSFPATMDDPETHPSGYLGERVLIRLINAGYQWRSMHLHGFHFEVIASDGRPLPQPYLKDTLSIAPGERYDILVQLDQLGAYPFHSHVVLDNMNNGRYPGGIHTMMTVTRPGEDMPAGSHHHTPPPAEPEVTNLAPLQDQRPSEVPHEHPHSDPSAAAGFGFTGRSSAPLPVSQVDEPLQGAAGEITITMSNDRFHPEHLVVTAGSSVTWVNADPRTHNIVAAQFESPDIRRNEAWQYTFVTPGTYVYECANHRGMEGVIIVR
jgi:manganese oxidase